MSRYMLDTNMVSHLIKGHATVAQRVVSVPMEALCISAITAGELSFGVAKRPEAVRLHAAVSELLRRVDVLPWDSTVANTYGALRAEMQKHGRTLSALDMLIAAHAMHEKVALVSNDRAFAQVKGLAVDDWTQA